MCCSEANRGALGRDGDPNELDDEEARRVPVEGLRDPVPKPDEELDRKPDERDDPKLDERDDEDRNPDERDDDRKPDEEDPERDPKLEPPNRPPRRWASAGAAPKRIRAAKASAAARHLGMTRHAITG